MIACQETWSCPLFGGEEIELVLGGGQSGYFGVHKINETTYKARRWVCGTGYVDVWTSGDPRECAAVLSRENEREESDDEDEDEDENA